MEFIGTNYSLTVSNNLHYLMKQDLGDFKKYIEACIDACELYDFESVEGLLPKLKQMYKKEEFNTDDCINAYLLICRVFSQEKFDPTWRRIYGFDYLLKDDFKDLIQQFKVWFSHKIVDNEIMFKTAFYNWYNRFPYQPVSNEIPELLKEECTKMIEELLKTHYISDPNDALKLEKIKKLLNETKIMSKKVWKAICWVKFFHSAYGSYKEQLWKLM